ncbi:MAG: TlpA family protein disulfide reductase [Planctomycetes bacterium]|nr:TlpA family protein disulfide reductase [Planctomycetota bacterium]
MNRSIKPVALFISLFVFLTPTDAAENLTAYRVVLESPGGELPFILHVGRHADSDSAELYAFIDNGEERIRVPSVLTDGRNIRLNIDHYDSTITLTSTADASGGLLPVPAKGIWRKRVGKDKWSQLPCSLTQSTGHRFKPLPAKEISVPPVEPVTGRWMVKFGKGGTPAIGIFKQGSDHTVQGTFLTTTGDYRYLSGSYEAGRLRLSVFDGGHAFLFDAIMQPDGTLKGDFWSRDVWHETWTAKRDAAATLPDGFLQVPSKQNVALSSLKYRNLDGDMVSLSDPEFDGKVVIVEIFGSWCPNCHDAADHLNELKARYGPRGLQVVGLAFEITGDVSRDLQQVRRFIERNGVKFPVLLGGFADKDTVANDVPLIDKLQSYPTMVFLDRRDKVRAIYSGYYGPATGKAHTDMVKAIDSVIETLLAENTP